MLEAHAVWRTPSGLEVHPVGWKLPSCPAACRGKLHPVGCRLPVLSCPAVCRAEAPRPVPQPVGGNSILSRSLPEGGFLSCPVPSCPVQQPAGRRLLVLSRSLSGETSSCPVAWSLPNLSALGLSLLAGLSPLQTKGLLLDSGAHIAGRVVWFGSRTGLSTWRRGSVVRVANGAASGLRHASGLDAGPHGRSSTGCLYRLTWRVEVFR